MDYQYGHFNAAGDEFIVTDPATPRAFDNFIWNESVFANIWQTGVGCFDYQIGDKEAVQLYTGNGRVCDFDIFGRDTLMNRLVYIRDNQNGAFWNLNWEPVCAPCDRFACTHGLGYSTIESETNGIRSSMRIFVPAGSDPVELWTLRFRNNSGSRRTLSVFAYNQMQFRYKWGFDSYGDMLFRSSHFDSQLNAVIASKHPYVRPHDYLTACLTSDEPIARWDGTRAAFTGLYGTLKDPQAVVNGRCTNTPGSSDATITAAQYDFVLEPGEEKEISVLIAVVKDEAGIAAFRGKYLGHFEEYFAELRARKQAMSRRFTVHTPDPHLDRMLNYWIKEQASFGAAWCRWGWNGYRDIVQHGFGVSSLDPARTRTIILEALRYQYPDGLALRGWNPVDTKPYSDSALWLAFTLVHYLRETADDSILSERIPFYQSEEVASVQEHIDRALDFLETHKGSHGLCLIKFGDWNDSLTAVGREGRGESVWLSEAYAEALSRLAQVMRGLGQPEKADDYEARRARISAAVNATAWDGEWYLRCFDDNGIPVGTHLDKEGQLFSESQGWALISGIADKGRAEKLLASCKKLLQTPQGFKLLAPTYTRIDDRVGRISSMEPGICENGTIYSHINIWLILGMLCCGLSEEAYAAFRRFTSGYISGPEDKKLRCPPYIYANGYYGPDHRNNAWQMEFTWITGSISWILNVLMNDFLGVSPELSGLRIRPCIPADWKEYEVVRQFRGAEYRITVRNPDGLTSGRVRLTVDGKELDGDLIPAFADGVHEVAAAICKEE